ncbi:MULTISPECIES: hypothetical protein [Chroococcidiopsis]|jgi:hypothetical protein|uniref:Uncharacterized protein n=1 Tax=Chroococcidiopsis thermalis (strain PCC 7203) TaxID=251229 RepID=K9U646_CHRTP|nr:MULTISPECIES: hypothetical protein [Chroococcidiopsis]AFY89881.1 hypothetical protein Chro_4489 [Chroococcidiopsis thermalis PCC 7203]URD49272.1 hypothetical protein M5J74_23475 [Chroococcidiopsis sp. CCNUC1]
MKKLTVSEHLNRDRLHLFFHLIPIIGFFPSLWTLYRHEGAGTSWEQGRAGGKRAEGEKRAEGAEGENTYQLPTTNYQLPITNYHKEKLAVSRLSITLALSWLLAYFLLSAGAEASEFLNFRLLMLNSLLTSGYFLVSVWLMLRLTTGKSVRLPGFSALADRTLDER